MSGRLGDAKAAIPISTELVKCLPSLTAAALRLYLFLLSLNCGAPVRIGVPAIAVGTGLGQRSTIEGLKALRDHALIIRTRGRGKHANSYDFPDLRCPAALAASVAGPDWPPVETVAGGCEFQPNIDHALRQRIALVYRPLTDQESSELREVEPDVLALSRKLATVRSVPRCFPFDRFTSILKTMAW